MTIDERLEFLVQSTESLHASCQELHATVAQQAESFAKDHLATERNHEALLTGMLAYLRALNGTDEPQNGDANGDS